MARSGSTDKFEGRFDVLDGIATTDLSWEGPMKDSSESSKRRRRKSAKGHNDDEQQQPVGSNAMSNGSSSGSMYRKPPLRTISELADLRTTSADVSTRFDIATQQHPASMKQARQTTDETQTARKPHLSLSFQDGRPATEGMASAGVGLTQCCMAQDSNSFALIPGSQHKGIRLPPGSGTPTAGGTPTPAGAGRLCVFVVLQPIVISNSA